MCSFYILWSRSFGSRPLGLARPRGPPLSTHNGSACVDALARPRAAQRLHDIRVTFALSRARDYPLRPRVRQPSRYISSQPPSKFGLLARSLPGSLPGSLLCALHSPACRDLGTWAARYAHVRPRFGRYYVPSTIWFGANPGGKGTCRCEAKSRFTPPRLFSQFLEPLVFNDSSPPARAVSLDCLHRGEVEDRPSAPGGMRPASRLRTASPWAHPMT